MAEKSSETSETGEAAADTPETREQMASKLVDRFALWSGVAGLVPVPVLDAVAVGGLQIQMVRRISQIYDVDFSENRGKALIASLAGSMIPATSGIGAASVLKAIPVIGTIAGGFVMPALSAGATYAIGTPGHSWQLTAQGKMPAAHKGLVHVAKVMAGTAVDVIRDEGLRARAKADHQARVGRNPYVCPLPDDLEPPIKMSA